MIPPQQQTLVTVWEASRFRKRGVRCLPRYAERWSTTIGELLHRQVIMQGPRRYVPPYVAALLWFGWQADLPP